jgi:hypothetical protein
MGENKPNCSLIPVFWVPVTDQRQGQFVLVEKLVVCFARIRS